jgi:hypothetical protein
MNRRLATVLNWLDALRSRNEFAKFECAVSTDLSGQKIVELRNLKVWVYHDQRRYWIAQGLDVGYVASAKDIETLQTRFMRGLATTVLVNLEKSGSVDAVLKPAPPEVWLEWRRAVRASHPPVPKRVVSEPRDVVPGLQAPAPKIDLSLYGCPA